jgi:predicted flavoprotein YhiN
MRPSDSSRSAVATKIEGNGKIFPVSDRAADVLAALVRRVDRSGASLRCLSPALGIERIDDSAECGPGFAIRLPDSTVTARRVIIAVGGGSYPGCGTTGDGYAIAHRFGHELWQAYGIQQARRDASGERLAAYRQHGATCP